MSLIKRIIKWLIAFFKRLFGKKDKLSKTVKIKKDKKKDKKKSKIELKGQLDPELPDYMVIKNYDKEMLIYSITLMKKFLEEMNVKRKEQTEKEIIEIIEKKYNLVKSDIKKSIPKIKEIANQKQLETIIKDLDSESKKEIINSYTNMIKKDEEFSVHLKEIDKVINKINNNDISIIAEDEIDREISNIVNDKEIKDNLEEKIDYFNKKIYELIDTIDEEFIKNVNKEYQVINYVTVSTMIIDKNLERFKKLEEDFKKHKFNKFYYEREVKKIKHQLNQIKDLKNTKEVNEHIDKLKKELFTKSKDKYDLLYNNEVFMNFDKMCDNLTNKINAKVVDIKKVENKKEEKTEEIKKKKYLENILRRFEDLKTAREYILMIQKEDNELINVGENIFIKNIYKRFNDGINLDFNFERNKQKTELVVLLNEINMVISKKDKEPYITLDHINFRMDDLIEAAQVKKDILSKKVNQTETEEHIKTDDKIKSLVYKPNGKKKTD